MRAALYARVSSAAQRERQTIESQLRDLHDYCALMGWSVAGVYKDDGKSAQSGRLGDRKDFARMLADAAGFDVVVVTAIDRLTRATDQTERGAILGAFPRAGVQLAVVGAGVQDLDSFAGDAYVTLQALGAAAWLREHRRRIVSGKLTAIARGRKPAGPTPYGYRYSRETGVWAIDDAEGAIVREVFTRVAGGESTIAIADDFNARGVPRHQRVNKGAQWERERVWAIAASPTYRGEWRANKKKRLSIPVPPIVDEALWHAARAALDAAGKRGLRRTKHVYLCEAIAVCACCGSSIRIASASAASWTSRNTRRPPNPARYVCRRYLKPLYGTARCEMAYRKVDDVDERLWAELRRFIDEEAELEHVLRRRGQRDDEGEAWTRDLATARARLERLQKAEEAILARFRHGMVSDAALDTELGAIGRERAMLNNQVAAATRAKERRRPRVTLGDQLAELRRIIDSADIEERRKLVELMFPAGAITIGPDSIVAEGLITLGVEASTSLPAEMALRFRLVA